MHRPKQSHSQTDDYFDCVSCCIEGDSTHTVRRLRDYKNYRNLNSGEQAQLLLICLALSPDKLVGSIMFPEEDIEGSSNIFLEVSTVSTKFVVAESLIVGGQSKKVLKIMLFKKKWMENNFIEPLRTIERSSRPRPRKEEGCVIL